MAWRGIFLNIGSFAELDVFVTCGRIGTLPYTILGMLFYSLSIRNSLHFNSECYLSEYKMA